MERAPSLAASARPQRHKSRVAASFVRVSPNATIVRAGRVRVSLNRELGFAGVPTLRERLRTFREGGEPILLDFDTR